MGLANKVIKQFEDCPGGYHSKNKKKKKKSIKSEAFKAPDSLKVLKNLYLVTDDKGNQGWSPKKDKTSEGEIRKGMTLTYVSTDDKKKLISYDLEHGDTVQFDIGELVTLLRTDAMEKD